MIEKLKFDPIFHQPVRTRLSILLYRQACSFTELRSKLQITDGNLDAHMKKLSAAGFIHSEMVINDVPKKDVTKKGRPYTMYELSPSGKKAFKKYLKDLEQTISLSLKT